MFVGIGGSPGEAAYNRKVARDTVAAYRAVTSAPKSPPVYEVQEIEVTSKPFPFLAVAVSAILVLIVLNSERH